MVHATALALSGARWHVTLDGSPHRVDIALPSSTRSRAVSASGASTAAVQAAVTAATLSWPRTFPSDADKAGGAPTATGEADGDDASESFFYSCANCHVFGPLSGCLDGGHKYYSDALEKARGADGGRGSHFCRYYEPKTMAAVCDALGYSFGPKLGTTNYWLSWWCYHADVHDVVPGATAAP